MRHDQRSSSVRAKEALHPENGVQIEMRGRLVEQQQVNGLGHKGRTRECRTLRPATAELLRRLALNRQTKLASLIVCERSTHKLLVGEPELVEEMLRACLRGERVDLSQTIRDHRLSGTVRIR